MFGSGLRLSGQEIGDSVDEMASSAYWFGARDRAMEAARVQMAKLMEPVILPAAMLRKADGEFELLPERMWRPALERNNPLVLANNAQLVKRARRCHAIAMRREPIFEDFSVCRPGGQVSGSLYAQKN